MSTTDRSLNGSGTLLRDALSHAALAVFKLGSRGVEQSNLPASRTVSEAERIAAYYLRARLNGDARRNGYGLIAQSPLHARIEAVPGADHLTMVVFPLSGPDLFTGEYSSLTAAPHAIMAGLFDGPDPSVADCLAAGILNLGTRERFLTDGTAHVLDFIGGTPDIEAPTSVNPNVVCIAGRDQQLAEQLAESGITLSGGIVTPGVRFMRVASGQCGATFGWAGPPNAWEAFIGIALARLAGCTTLNLAGSEELGLITLADVLAHGVDFVIAGSAEMAKQLTTAIHVPA